MELSSTTENGIQLVGVHAKRIDAASAVQFKDAMRQETETGPAHVVLDLSNVDFIDSSGLGAIVASMKHLGGGRRMDLAGMTPDVDKVFRLTRMDKIFTIHASASKALTARKAG
ncbi:STAS domain-containing protein [Roseovarius aestuariivivens]|uniref:STAS domain-containing protein n=1 Tax=Roseovarius aestuariivivens TaxID=1888910 RepID=UPI001081DDA9|nr:STAS domain-containing protein [Roseovarius aestuariivivens]